MVLGNHWPKRLTAAGVSPPMIAQMLGHSSTQIVPRYAQVLDQNRLDAMRKWANGSTEEILSAAELDTDLKSQQ